MGHLWSCEQRGAAAVGFILLLPLLLLAMALAVDVARLVVVRAQVQSAADLGSLAAVQELDLDRLREGQPWLRVEDAEQVARQWVTANLQYTLPEATSQTEIDVLAINAIETAPRRHPWTGRWLRDPTVAVRIVVPVRMMWIPGRPTVHVRVQADASVVALPE